MNSDWLITYFCPDRQGIFFIDGGVRFAVDNSSGIKDSGILFYDRRDKVTRIPFSEQGRRGTLYGIQVKKENITDYRYNFYFGDEIVTDAYAVSICGLEKWGAASLRRKTCGGLCRPDFDWGEDKPPLIPYEDSILYGLNVRGFTRHKSSGVKHPGTFEGIVEKADYLKELGITGVVLMPCYEYDECMYPLHRGESMEQEKSSLGETSQIRLNCWGFQKGWYFAPKASYSAFKTPEASFKAMVKELHRCGIEVIMHFYFPPEISQLYILEVIKFWELEYHIDGVRLSGMEIPFQLLAQEPVLRELKIWGEAFTQRELEAVSGAPVRNFAADNPDYAGSIRRFLKGDEGQIENVLSLQRRNPAGYGVINYLADYKGFSLYDCVSYDRKHNEENGENNQDGAQINYSWNCGVEGETRKKAVVTLRLRQIKNALSFLLLGQGTPFLFSGDEMANTRRGNNNGYCQDNDIGWIKWRSNSFAQEVLAYTRFLIRLRKEHRILHMPRELRIMDSMGNGYPDLSYHGMEAWRPDLSYMSRMVGIVQCGQYVPDGKDDFFYFACNMHWEPHKLALPKLPKGERWVKLSDTCKMDDTEAKDKEVDADKETRILVAGRSISIYRSRKQEIKAPKKKNGKTA